tara:strand:- start:6737 stop:7570 length:834 start_codon:yes stop_codon:yes gene_type:complete
MRKPNLFLVGAPKAGTSTVWAVLKEHKDIFFAQNPEKEVNYFSNTELKNNSYYKDYEIKSEKQYLNIFRKGQHIKYIADGSVSYFAYLSVPKKIYDFNPEAKIIIIVRDPIDRAFSHFKMDKRMGYAKNSLLDYLKNKDGKHDNYIHQYIENSLYYKHTKNFLKYFDKKQVLIMRLDQLKLDFDKLYKFLDIERPKSVVFPTINRDKEPTNNFTRMLQHNRHFAKVLKKFIPKKIARYFDFLIYKEAKKIYLTETERSILKKYLIEDYNKFNNTYKK